MNVYWNKLRKKLQRTAISMALLCCLLFSLPQAAHAADAIDPTRVCSLTLICRYSNAPLSGMNLRLYRVADGTAETGFTMTGAFASSGVAVNGLDNVGWVSAAKTLSGYVITNSIAATESAQTDANGAAVIGDLSQGLYLAVGDTLTIGTHSYVIAPFLVALPNPTETGGWNYDITAYPKITDPTETEPSYYDITVLLQWSDAGYTAQRPTTIGITLLRDGKVYENYTLSAASNWRHTWSDLSDEYDWSVVQTSALDTYRVTYSRTGNVLIITDIIQGSSEDSDDEDDSIPQTGILWWPVYAMAIGGVLLFTLGWRRRYRARGKRDAS